MASDEWDDKGQGLPNSYILHIQMLPTFFSKIFYSNQKDSDDKNDNNSREKMLPFLPQTLNPLKISHPFLFIQAEAKRHCSLLSTSQHSNFDPTELLNCLILELRKWTYSIPTSPKSGQHTAAVSDAFS